MRRDPVAELEQARRARPGARVAERALEAAGAFVPRDAAELARLHDAALFLRAYPQSPRVLALADEVLSRVPGLVARLADEGADLAPLDDPSVAGIAGVPVAIPFSHAAASWLARRDAAALRVDWDAEDLPDRLAAFLPRLIPLLEEQARVDANVPFREYVDAARGARPDAAWLLERLAALPVPDSVRAELWEALSLQLSWRPRATDSRGLARVPSPAPFCSDAPLLSRRDVSVAAELAAPPPAIRLSRSDGSALLDAARAAMAVRYRELPAFSAGDPSAVFRFDVGRGVSIYVTGLAREARLPLRAAFGTLFARNGVLVGYGDLHAALGRADVSFNVFYAFRDGESAWLYARLLAVCRAVSPAQLSVDPYQVGLGNEEAIASGAFWFYRKLGFRSAEPSLERIARREEALSAASPGRRTPPATLRRLAAAPLLLDVPGETPLLPDTFRLADLGRAAARRFAASRLSPEVYRARAADRASRALGLPRLDGPAREALLALAPALALLDDLASWPTADRRALADLLRAKAAPDELRCARLSSKHRRLAATLVRAAQPAIGLP